MKVLSVGEVLWDVFSGGEFLGGAPLNFCANLQRCGDEAILVSGVGDDDRGRLALEAMRHLGFSTARVKTVAERATGTAKVYTDARGEARFVIARPAAFDAFQLTDSEEAGLTQSSPDWLYMGTLLQTAPAMEELVSRLVNGLPGTRIFYDMNLRTGHWTLDLVERLCGLATVLKLNEVEAALLAGLSGGADEEFSLDRFCAVWAERFGIGVICVTLGADGCCIFADGAAVRYAGQPIEVSDTVGAGDAFAAAFLHGFHRMWPLARCAAFANALGALVASRPGATPAWDIGEVAAMVGGLEAIQWKL